MEQPRTIHDVSNEDLINMTGEIELGGSELEAARALLRREMARRGILVDLNTASLDMPVYDAQDDNPHNPREDTSKWICGNE